jgi:hypothetical protein
MRNLITVITLSASLFVLEQAAFAFQGFGRPGTPTVTPYLNLVPGRNRVPALNYYRSYRPELEFRQANRQLGRSIRSLQSEIERPRAAEQSDNSQLGTTGHPTTFGNTSTYFSSSPLRR